MPEDIITHFHDFVKFTIIEPQIGLEPILEIYKISVLPFTPLRHEFYFILFI